MGMYCTNCGKEVPDGAVYCMECGVAVGNTAAPKKNGKKTAVIIVAVVLAAVIIAGSVLGIVLFRNKKAKEELQRKLTTIDWSRVESGENDSFYTLRLDFDDDEIEYDFDSFYIDENIATFDYEVISGDEIRIDDGRTITIEFSDDMFVMTMKPALTSVDSSEFWYNHED